MVGNRRQGWAIYAAMLAAVRGRGRRSSTPPRSTGRPRSTSAGRRRRPGNLEGKEQRFGIADSALWTGDHDGRLVRRRQRRARLADRASAALVPLFNMSTGEVVFGGVGSGLYGMLLFVLLAVFIAGLMVGPHARVPRQEDRGARGQARDGRHARSCRSRCWSRPRSRSRRSGARRRSTTRARRASPRRSTPTSRRRTTTARRSPATPASCSRTRPATSARSGSPSPTCSAASRCCSAASCRWSPRSPWPGRSRRKRVAPLGPGTFRTDTPTFVLLLIATIVIVAALTFFPAFLLGPIVQGLTDQLF